MSVIKPSEPEISIKVFIVYAREDLELREKLEAHLSLLKYFRKITIWQDQEILPGADREDEINTHLNSADLILLLVSSDFMASKYCWNKVEVALERHRNGTAQVIPVILRSVSWQKDTPLGKLQALPTGAKPVKQWDDEDAALMDVEQGIRKVVETLRSTLRQEVQRTEKVAAKQEKLRAEAQSLKPQSTQLYYTSSAIGSGPAIGFRIRAQSPDVSTIKPERMHALMEYLTYRLPIGADQRRTAVDDAPISLILAKTGYNPVLRRYDRVLLHRKYVGQDAVGRPGNFFIHAIIDPEVVSPQTGTVEPISAYSAINLWKSPFWKTSEDQVPPQSTEIGDLTLQEIRQLTTLPGMLDTRSLRQEYLHCPDGLQTAADWLPVVFSAFLMLKKLNKRQLYIAAPSEMVAIFIWCIIRCLPRTLTIVKELTFSTYEHEITRAPMVIVGTCWLPPVKYSGPFTPQTDLPDYCYQDQPNNLVLAINCYNQRQTPFEINEQIQQFTRFVTSLLLRGDFTDLDAILTRAEYRGYREIEELLALFRIHEEAPAEVPLALIQNETPTMGMVQNVLARPELWSSLLYPSIQDKLIGLIKNQEHDPNWQSWWQNEGRILVQQMRQCVLEQPESVEAAALSAFANKVLHEEALIVHTKDEQVLEEIARFSFIRKWIELTHHLFSKLRTSLSHAFFGSE